MGREPDECLRCHLPVPQGDGILVPARRGGKKRPCHLACALDLRGWQVMELSERDRAKLFGYGVRKTIPQGRRLGLSPRDFAKARA